MSKRFVEFIIKGKDNTGPAFNSLGGKLKGFLTSGVGLAAMLTGTVEGLRRMARAATQAYGKMIAEDGKYQKAVAEVVTLTGSNRAETRRLSSDLQDLSVKFGRVNSVMAKAEYNVVSAGFGEVAESLHVLDVASRAAVGGVTDVNTAAKGITQTLNAYKLGSQDAERVAGILFATVKGGVTTFEELAANLGKVTSTGYAAGVELEELAAGVAVLTKNGLSSEQATTALNSLIIALGAASGESKDKLDALGINLDRGLAPALAAVNEAGGDSLQVLRELVPDTQALKAAASAGADGARELRQQLALMGNGVEDFNAATDTMMALWDLATNRQIAALGRLREAIGATAVEGQTAGINGLADALNTLAIAVEENTDGIKLITKATGEMAGAAVGGATSWDKFAVKMLDANAVSSVLGINILQTRWALEKLGVEFDTAAKKATDFSMVELPAGQMGPLTVPVVFTGGDMSETLGAGLGPFVKTAAETGATASRAALDAYAEGLGVASTEKVLDPETLQWVDVPKTRDKMVEDITAAMAEASEIIAANPPEPVIIPKITEAPEPTESEKGYEDDGEIRLLEDIIALEAERKAQLETTPVRDVEPTPERVKELNEAHAEWLAQQEQAEEAQKRMADAVADVGRNFERLGSDSLASLLKGEQGAIMFGRTLRTVVIDALSAVAAKMLAIQAIKLFSGLGIFEAGGRIPGYDRGGRVPGFALGGSVPVAANGYAIPDGPRGLDSRLIMGMPGEEVINRKLSMRLERFITSQESAAMASPFDVGTPAGGGGPITLSIARPMSYLDSLDLGDQMAVAARTANEGQL